MTPRRLTIAAAAVTYLQLVFGGIVRITGSGMGCGDHWPKCNGSWIPPFDQPMVMIEWTHRLLALLVVITVGLSAWVARREAVPGGEREKRVARAATTGFALVIAVALLGMITVKLGNTAIATVGHWTLAMTLMGVLVAAAVRAGGLGGEAAAIEGGTSRTMRSLGAGAAMALGAVVLGALTAKIPGANAACPSFPLCGASPDGDFGRVRDLQISHRLFAFVLLFHLGFAWVAQRRRRGESRATRRATGWALGIVAAQIVFGASMIMADLAPALRLIHEATGVAVWVSTFLAAYLARTAASGRPA